MTALSRPYSDKPDMLDRTYSGTLERQDAMTTITQIFWGSALLVICSVLHVFVLVYLARYIRRFFRHLDRLHEIARWSLLISAVSLTVVFAHTIQVWAWALALYGMGALSNMSDSIYFSIITYTTVGYGDVTLDHNYRVFAAMASVTGLLNFGLSTAFLVGLFTRMLENDGNHV